jgi:hypothetical protein
MRNQPFSAHVPQNFEISGKNCCQIPINCLKIRTSIDFSRYTHFWLALSQLKKKKWTKNSFNFHYETKI